MDREYLSITIHDNDFSRALKIMSSLLYEIFEKEEDYPTEESLPALKKYIQSIWYGIHNVIGEVRWRPKHNAFESDIEIFNPDLKFVNYEEIPEWDDGETAYIPMFDDGKIMIR